MRKLRNTLAIIAAMAIVSTAFAGCGSSESNSSGASADISSAETDGDRIIAAAQAGKVGNWGLGNEYEILALLTKYGQKTEYLSQSFDMDGFDDGSITLASAMTYNELGLVKNSYEGGYGYGDNVGIIDMNDEGVAMLEDNLFCTKEFAQNNPNTVKAFISASMKGWEYACQNPEEAAQIVFEAGSSVSSEHQAYMASEVKKLVETDTDGNAVNEYGKMDEEAMQQTLDLRNTSYWEEAMSGSFGTPEKSSVSIQLKWLPQCQFMGYYVAKAKGYYDEVGLSVDIVSGGGDIGETTAVNNGTVDFGVTWVSNLISANSGGMDLLEIAQVYQRSGLVLVYKK